MGEEGAGDGETKGKEKKNTVGGGRRRFLSGLGTGEQTPTVGNVF